MVSKYLPPKLCILNDKYEEYEYIYIICDLSLVTKGSSCHIVITPHVRTSSIAIEDVPRKICNSSADNHHRRRRQYSNPDKDNS